MTVPVWPKGFGSNASSSQVFILFKCLALAVVTFVTLKWALQHKIWISFKCNKR